MEMERPMPVLAPDNKPEALVGTRECERELMGGWGSEPSALFPPPIGPGLANLGNTCFVNAVLQCLTHTVPLVQSLRALPHQTPCTDVRGGVAGGVGNFCSICALRQHLETCFYAMGNAVLPCVFVDNLINISSSFSRYEQEDAHEFLNCLFDSLHTCCLDPQSRDGPSSFQRDSFIKQIFGGRLRSQVKCCDCGHVSNTFEPLLDLSLEIEDAESLEEALESFTKVEKIEDPETKFTCDGCNARVSVEKHFTLDHAPPVVALHLKRFKSNGYFANKIDKFVEYPVNLDLKPFLSAPNDVDSLTYELYAVLVHDGCSSFYGHYFCFIRSSPDAWYMMDDDMVARRDEKQALGQSAYILFYMKQGTPWFSSLIEEQWKNVDTNSASKASPPRVPGHMEKLQDSSFDSEDNSKSWMETLNRDESLNLSDGASLDAHMSLAAMVNCENLMTVPREDEEVKCTTVPSVDEEEKRSGNASIDTNTNEAERDDALCSLEARKYNISRTEDNQPDIGTDGQNIASCRPSSNKLSTNNFYDEPWDEDEKENPLELHAGGKNGKCANEVDERGQAALSSLGPMLSSRTDCSEKVMHHAQPSANAERRRRKKKKHLDHQNAPCHASSMPSMRQVPCTPMHDSVLHKPLVGDGSQLNFAAGSNHSDKRTD